MVNRSGTVRALKVRLAGIVRVVSTTPGRIEPQGEPMPPKFEAELKLPPPVPVTGPSVEVKGTEEALPVPGLPNSPKLGPVPPMNGNCTKGWLKAGRKSTLLVVNSVEPLTRV